MTALMAMFSVPVYNRANSDGRKAGPALLLAHRSGSAKDPEANPKSAAIIGMVF
jgi:hypothetical protein